MVMFVSLQQASDHLRRDTSDDDDDLELKIKAASAAIINYVKTVDFLDSDGEVPIDSDGNPIGVPEEIQMAALILIGVLYADRDAKDFTDPRSGSGAPRLGNISLPRTVHWLLDPLRDPTVV